MPLLMNLNQMNQTYTYSIHMFGNMFTLLTKQKKYFIFIRDYSPYHYENQSDQTRNGVH